MELRDYLKVVRRRWRVILVSLIVVVALASLITLRTTPQYESKARLFVSSTERLGLQMSPAALSEKITATVVPDTVILEVSATDPDPKQAQRIGQAVAVELTKFVSELETPPGKSNAPRRRSF